MKLLKKYKFLCFKTLWIKFIRLPYSYQIMLKDVHDNSKYDYHSQIITNAFEMLNELHLNSEVFKTFTGTKNVQTRRSKRSTRNVDQK